MKASQERSKKSDKGVSFSTLETKETTDRHSSIIDKLTSLVNKLDMKLDRQEAHRDLQSIRIEVEVMHKDKITMNIETGPIVEIGIIPTTEVEETFITIAEVIGPTIEVDQDITGMEIAIEGGIIPKAIGKIIINKTMVTKGTGIGTEV